MTGKIKYHKIIKYLVSASCTQPLHIGSASGDKEEVLVHPTDGIPFIQASGILGALRQYYEQTHDEKQAEKLFGAKRFAAGSNSFDGASKVRLSDGVFCGEAPILELRPQVKIDPATGTCSTAAVRGTNRKAGHKFNMEYIGAGAEFAFSIYLYDEDLQNDLEEVLSAVHKGYVQFGGQKSSGCGFMTLKGLKRKIFNMSDEEDRRKWADEETLSDKEYSDILSEIKTPSEAPAAYEIYVTGSTEGELLVKSIAVSDYGKGAPDCMNIRNAAKEYIVPGSSFKGAVRSRMEKIAAYIERDGVIQKTFGDNDISGNVVFYDTVVGNKEDNDKAEIKNRIHIDKFTGGVMHGGLFNEKNISGNVAFQIAVNDRNNPDATCGLLLMALRDMALGIVSVGGGYSVGKGIIDVSSITVCDCKSKKKAAIDYTKSAITGDDEIMSRCMKAVQTKEAAG